jgi:hypothetical protein
MKTILLIAGLLLFGNFAGAQFESKAVADAKKYFPGYSQYEYSHKTQKVAGLRYYYRCTVEAYKNANFKCYPNAKLNKSLWVEYWSNGQLKDKGTWIGTSIKNVPNPDVNSMTAALKDSFDPIAYFESSWLWNLLEIHGYELEKDMTGQHEPLWRSETEVWVDGSVTASIIRGCCDVVKYKFYGVFQFTSSDCGKTFQLKDSYRHGKKVEIERKSVSKQEGIELQKKTIGRSAAEDKAKEEWNALTAIDIPEFDHAQAFAAYVYQMITSGTEDEVKSVIYRTLPSYKFMEGSQYLLDWSAQEYVDNTMNQILDNNGVNVQTNFCPVINRRKNETNAYTFHDKAEESTLTIRVTKEDDGWKVKEFKIWLADGIKDKPCPEMIEYEEVKNDEFGFSIKMPKGYKTTKQGSAIILEKKINGSKYIFVANKFGDGGSNDARKKQAEDNVHGHLMDIHSLDEKETTWEMNGVTGGEVFFLAENTKYERYRTIYLGDYNYEMWILGLNFTETDDVFFDSFKSEGAGGGAREDLKFEVGDPVEIHVGAGRYEKGNVTAVNADGTYNVKVPNMGKTFTAPIDAMKADPNGKKVESAGSSTNERPDSYKVGDKVLIRVSQTDWVPGEVKEDKGNGKYRVEVTDSGDQYIQPIKNLKPDPNAKSGGKKRKLPNVKLR